MMRENFKPMDRFKRLIQNGHPELLPTFNALSDSGTKTPEELDAILERQSRKHERKLGQMRADVASGKKADVAMACQPQFERELWEMKYIQHLLRQHFQPES